MGAEFSAPFCFAKQPVWLFASKTLDKKLITIKGPDGNIDTGIKKIGAFLGDNVEIGCGSVLNPGTIIGRNSNIYPLSSVRGCIKSGSIYKNRAEVVEKY